MQLIIYFVQALCFAKLLLAISIEHGSLRAQDLLEANSLSTLTPKLSWRLLSGKRNESQTAFQLQAASTREGLQSPDLWDTGKLIGDNISTLYTGIPLSSRSIVYWRVRVWDKLDHVCDWSETSNFEIGLTKSSDWSAQWIANNNFQLGNTSLPLFAKSFHVNGTISKARLYLLGLGMQNVLVNGRVVGDQVLVPGYSNFNKTLVYTTYDLSEHLVEGSNVLGVELGRGVWDAQKPLGGRYTKFTAPENPLEMIAQLEYTLDTGEIYTIISDGTWKTSVSGPLLESAWYGGEEYDATKEILNWSSPKGDRSQWSTATLATRPPGNLVAVEYPPLKIVDRLKPVNITGPINGQYVLDFGTNFAGWYSLRINEKNGTRVTIWPAERLTQNGAIDQSTTGSPIYDAFTSAGRIQVFQPKFMYHGFRYLGVNLTSAPALSDGEGLVIRTACEPVGYVSTSDSMLNSIHEIIDRAIQSNIYSVMTDCPHREKLGWLEQSHLVFQPVARGYDVQAYGRNIVQTILDSQLENGLVPDISPEFVVFSGGYRDDPNWGNALILLPLMLYQTYGEIELLEQGYAAMELYIQFLAAKTSNYILKYGLGDWIAFDTSTPKGITATFGYYQALDGMKTIASALGKSSDVEKYSTMLSALLLSFQSEFAIIGNGSYNYGSGSQASNAIALDMGVVPSESRATVAESIISSILANGDHLSVGEIALPPLFRALQSQGQQDVIYRMMTVPTSPSYAYQVNNGATSLTERWDGPTATCAGCNSLNHFMLGYADQWLAELSGLSQAQNSIAWNTINFSPILVTNITSASSSYRSIRGLADASWKLSQSSFTYSVTVPVGAAGLVIFDIDMLGLSILEEDGITLSAGHHGNGIIDVTTNDNRVTVRVGSGQYNFIVT